MIARLACLALATAAGLAAAPAHAQRVEQRIEFIERELNRRCAFDGLSRRDLGGMEGSTTRCRASIEPGRIDIEVRRRVIGADGDASISETIIEIDFASNALFYCSRVEPDGFATLFMNCNGLRTLSGERCVRRETADGFEEYSTFTILLSIPPDACGRLRRALSFVAERTAQPPPSEF